MIGSFRSLPSYPGVILLVPVVSFIKDSTGIWCPIIFKIIPKIQQVAYDENLEVSDVHSLLINKPELLADQIYPNAKGSGIIAKRLCELVSAKRDTKFDIFPSLDPSKKNLHFTVILAQILNLMRITIK